MTSWTLDFDHVIFGMHENNFFEGFFEGFSEGFFEGFFEGLSEDLIAMNVSDDNFYSSDLNSSGSISVYSFISSSNDSSNSPSVSEPSESDSKGLISGIKWETAKPSDTKPNKPIGTGLYGTGSESGSRLINSNLNCLAVNVRGIMCHGRSEQARLLMIKHKASIAVLSETETTHSYSRQPIWRVLGLSAPLKLLLDPLVRKLESS